jgi:hypothetical protein
VVVGVNYFSKRKEFYFLKYFFQLWKRWISSGGCAHGRRVLRGQIAYRWWFFFNLNYLYSIWNTLGIIQFLYKSIHMSSTLGLVFYPLVGLFSINPLENTHETNSFLLHNTTTDKVNIRGNSFVLANANLGFIVFAIQSWVSYPAVLARAAGCYAKIVKKNDFSVFVQLPSTLIYAIPRLVSATLGLSSKKFFLKMTKAGQSRYRGRAPKVRGIAMNPVDHPHGGRTNKGGHPVTPSGWLTKGVKTRHTAKWSAKKIYATWTKII